jgi:hypothetical protein
MLASGGNLDVIVAKYDQNGFYVIAKRAGDAQSQFGLLTRIDPAGNIVVTGAFAGTMDLGGGPANSAGGYDAFVAKLDPGSNYVWMKHWGDNQDQGGVRVGVDAQANVLVAGDFKGDIDFGKGPVTSKGQDDSFLVKLAP